MNDKNKNIEAEDVIKRISDWKKRISDLYATIDNWLINTEYNIKPGPKTIMYEELMSLYNLEATKLDTIDILRGRIFVMSIKPKGLWIIGANGRIDLLSLSNNVILVDIAKQFEQPQWKLYDNNKLKGVDFNSDIFLNLLSKS